MKKAKFPVIPTKAGKNDDDKFTDRMLTPAEYEVRLRSTLKSLGMGLKFPKR